MRTTTMTHIIALAPGAARFVVNQWRQAWRTVTTKRETAPSGLAEELAAVRALADSYRACDPGFAGDLYAAADRHERAFDSAPAR
jgi:hypothetical protein